MINTREDHLIVELPVFAPLRSAPLRFDALVSMEEREAEGEVCHLAPARARRRRGDIDTLIDEMGDIDTPRISRNFKSRLEKRGGSVKES